MKTNSRYPVGEVLEVSVKLDVASIPPQQSENSQSVFHSAMMLALGVPQDEIHRKIQEKPLPSFPLSN